MRLTDHYISQAEAAETAAETALLDNVRDRNLRSAAAWREMADRASRTDKLRAERDAASLERAS